jgi:hypothetical protein
MRGSGAGGCIIADILDPSLCETARRPDTPALGEELILVPCVVLICQRGNFARMASAIDVALELG